MRYFYPINISFLMVAISADFLPWHEATYLIRKLEENGDYRMCLLTALGCFWGLRIGEILSLNWNQIYGKDTVVIELEKSSKKRKTVKTRTIEIIPDVKNLIGRLYDKMNVKRITDPVFLNPNTGSPITSQGINAKLKRLAHKYELSISNFSTHTFRKTFGRHYWEQNNGSDKSLTILCEIFQHESIRDTRRYLGINRQEIKSAYYTFKL